MVDKEKAQRIIGSIIDAYRANIADPKDLAELTFWVKQELSRIETTSLSLFDVVRAIADLLSDDGGVSDDGDIIDDNTTGVDTTWSSQKIADRVNNTRGEVNTQSNVGLGAGLALPKSGVNLPLKSLIQGVLIELVEEADAIRVNALSEIDDTAITADRTWSSEKIAAMSSSGESNTSSNVGSGIGLAKAKVGTDLPFKTLIAGVNAQLTDTGDEVVFGVLDQIVKTAEVWTVGATGDFLNIDAAFAYYNERAAAVTAVGSGLTENYSAIRFDLQDEVHVPTTTVLLFSDIPLSIYGNGSGVCTLGATGKALYFYNRITDISGLKLIGNVRGYDNSYIQFLSGVDCSEVNLLLFGAKGTIYSNTTFNDFYITDYSQFDARGFAITTKRVLINSNAALTVGNLTIDSGVTGQNAIRANANSRINITGNVAVNSGGNAGFFAIRASDNSTIAIAGTVSHTASYDGAEATPFGEIQPDGSAIFKDGSPTSTTALIDLSTDAVLSSTTVVPPTSPIANPPYAVCFDCAATNLIPNPKFAASPFDWGYIPATGVPGAVISLNTSNPWIGTQCAQVSTSALNQGIETQYLPIIASTRYIFSIYLRGNVGGEDVVFQFVPTPGGPNTTIGAKFLSAGRLTNKWARYVFEVTTGPSHTNAACRILSNVGTAQTFFIDGLQLEVENVDSSLALQQRYVASSYLDGDMGRGFFWTGTPNQSSSSRLAGYHFIGNHNKPPWGRLTIRPDGSIGNLTLRADRDGFDEFGGANTSERFPYLIYGDMFTTNLKSGSLASLIKIINERGSCIWLESGTTDDAGVIFNFPSITSGVGMAIYAPNDLDTMAANNGRFFAFLDKISGSAYSWFVDRFEVGAGNSLRNKQVIQHNGGRAGLIATVGTVTLVGNITCTAGGTVTGTGGTTFLADFVPGDQVGWVFDGGIGDSFITVASIESNTSMTVVPYGGGPVAATARAYKKVNNKADYSPAILMLESDRSSHANTVEVAGIPVKAGEYWGLFPSSHDGLWRSHKSASFGSKEMPANAQDGDAFHMTRGFAHAITITGVTGWTDVATLYTLRQSAHYPGATYKLRFLARIPADTVATDTYQYRVVIGATNGPLGGLIQVDSTGIVNVEGEITMTYLAAGAGWRIMNIVKHIGNGSINSPSLVHSAASNIAAITDVLPQAVKLQINPSNSARSMTFDIITLERIC